MIPKTYREIFCGRTRQEWNFLEGACPVTSSVKLTQQFRKRTNLSNLVIVVLWSRAALLLQDLDDLL